MSPSAVATVSPAKRVRGRLRVPGDKSISHRYALIAAICHGPSRLINYAPGADCRSTLACLEALGVGIRADHDVIIVEGAAIGALQRPASPLDAGNSGSTMRMIAGILAAQPFASTVVGDASLSRRPMRRI